ncbi:MAG: transporter substrate-binding domain-containing protein [Tannerella sp.]|jgi:membrane-bound lytic murein transglycosylase MltF|nr:transporter substrate-binding domain-containing protein [Tannerella sp.]
MFTGKLLKTYIVLLLAVICIMAMLIYFKPVPVRDYPEIRREGVLRIVTEYGQAGYYVADGSQIEGFQYALCREIARQADMEVLMYLEMNLEKSFYGLSTNQYDIIARNIPVTGELKEKYLFLEPVVLNRQVLVQRTAAAGGTEPLRNQLNLAHKTLHVPENSPALLRLNNLQKEIGDTIFVVEDPLYSSEQLCIMVAKGDIDFAVCDRQIAQLSKKQFAELDIDTDISFTQLQSWAVRKDAAVLADSLNRWLQNIRDSGAYDRIYRQHYSR